MICKNAEEIIKSASIEQAIINNIKGTYRAGRWAGGKLLGLSKLLGKGSLAAGKGIAATAERTGDFIARNPVTAISAAVPIGYAGYHANDIIDRQLNNINPGNAYMDSWRRPNYNAAY